MADLLRDGQALSYRTLLAVAEAIVSHRDLQALFHDLAGRLQQVVGFDYLVLLLHEAASDTLRLHLLESAEPLPAQPPKVTPVEGEPGGLVLQEQEFERLGSTRTVRVNVRLVAATNRDLAQMVSNRQFRDDLYYRLNVFPVVLPPLRERREDIPWLARHFVQKVALRMGRRIETIPAEAMDVLVQYPWPGNIRELENVIERAVILSPGPALHINVGDLKAVAAQAKVPPGAVVTLADADRDHILGVLRGNRLGAERPDGCRGPPGDEASDLAVEDEETGHLPAPVVLARCGVPAGWHSAFGVWTPNLSRSSKTSSDCNCRPPSMRWCSAATKESSSGPGSYPARFALEEGGR